MDRDTLQRREFGKALVSAAAASLSLSPATLGAAVSPRVEGSLTDVPGIRVGHFTHDRRPTGCTVVLCGDGAVAGVDVRGGAPGTRETDVLDPVNLVQEVQGVVLSGGSAFGLDTAAGVVRFLEEQGRGIQVGPAHVPVVPAAILFDLGVGDWKIRPDAASGYAAAQAASTARPSEGNVGAGAGATVGKLFGMSRAMKGGLGTASAVLPGGVVVGALVAVNSVGDVTDPESGEILAGARTADGLRLEGTVKAVLEGRVGAGSSAGSNTTIGLVATNVRLTKTQATKVAQMAHDGLARAVRPVHTPWDGDTLFALSLGTLEVAAPDMLVGCLAAEVVARAVLRGVRAASSLPGLPSAAELSRRGGR